jgi:hypothetical protein
MVRQNGLLAERACYGPLHSYRRSELPHAAALVVDSDIQFASGIGLYSRAWLERTRLAFTQRLASRRTLSLGDVLHEVRERWPELAACEDATIEALFGMWPEIRINRSSIFDATIELASSDPTIPREIAPEAVEKDVKKTVRERRPASRRRTPPPEETTQANLWG